MKARIKFRKYGVLRFIGHLDVMRFFQKVMRRADIPIAFTGGYSPHMIMSFASPLGIGLESDGEYLDIELTSPIESREAVRRMNEVSVEGIEILSSRQIAEEKKRTGMTILAGADYLIRPNGFVWSEPMRQYFSEFMAQDMISVIKQTKRSERMIDIRPLIYRWEFCEEGLRVQTAAGSSENLKPDLIMDTFVKYMKQQTGEPRTEPSFSYKRLEMYADVGDGQTLHLIPLADLGHDIIKENLS